MDRPKFSTVTATDLDRLLQEVQLFAGKVCSFGNADGFFKIHVVEGTYWNVDLPDGWKHHRPDFFDYVSTAGVVFPVEWKYKEFDDSEDQVHKYFMELKESEDLRSALQRNDPLLVSKNEDNNYLHWIITAKASLAAVGSEYDVRTGFHTRVVSPSFDLAFQHTRDLWEEEHKKEEWEKEDHDVKHDYNSYAISLALEEETLKPIVEGLKSESLLEGKYFNSEALTTKQRWTLYKHIQELKEDIEYVESSMKQQLNDKSFEKFYKQEKELEAMEDKYYDETYTDSGIPLEKVTKSVKQRRERLNNFYKKLGIEEEE